MKNFLFQKGKKLLFLLSLLGLVSVGCSPKKVDNTTSDKLVDVKAGHLVALDMAPLFVGVESECFVKNGINVETVAFTNPGDNNAALAGGSIDFSTNPFTLPFFAANSGVPIKTISAAGGWGVMQVIAKDYVGASSISDLKGFVKSNPDKKLKIATLRGDTLELILVDAFEDESISEDNFEFVYFDDLLAMVESFRVGAVDILSHIKPYTTQFIVSGDANLLTDNFTVWSPKTPNTVVSVLENTLTSKPEIVTSYIKGMQCAASIINDEPEKAISLLKQGNYYRVEDDVLLEAFTSQPSPITFTPDLNSIQTVVDKMVDLNYIKNDVPTSKIFDIDIVSELEK